MTKEPYTYKHPDGTKETFMTNAKEVEELQRRMKISHLEALYVWCCDEGLIVDPIQAELNAKAAGQRVNTGAKAKRKAPTRKKDENKIAIISYLSSSLGDNAAVGDITITNEQGEIVFNIGDDEFKLKLTKTRK